jgi:predicted acetyltransferase
LLITCDNDNTASGRIIETMGGRLQGTFVSETCHPGALCRRYLVDITG